MPVIAIHHGHRQGFYLYDPPVDDVDLRFSWEGSPMPGQGAYGGPPDQGGPPVGHSPSIVEETDDKETDVPAPDVSNFKKFTGYENVGGIGQAFTLTPPSAAVAKPIVEAPLVKFSDILNLQEDDCRQAMLCLVAEKSCWGKKAAKDMTINRITGSTLLHYTLETYSEGRSINYEYEPYLGQVLDGPENGQPPPAWSVEVTPRDMFSNQCRKVEVPHTAVVKSCHRCRRDGVIACKCCHGNGHTACRTCVGTGQRTHGNKCENKPPPEVCHGCQGSGKIRCVPCRGSGRVTCSTCKGHRQLKWYIALTVKFMNHHEDFVRKEAGLPEELLRMVSGFTIFKQMLPQVWPISSYHVKEINDNSARLVEKHRTAFPSEKQIMQRHILRTIPLTQCEYSWKGKERKFWVYGLDRKVRAPDYPQQRCWGCQIM